MQKKTTIQYLLGIGLALLTIPIVEGTLAILPDIGWHFMTTGYIAIFMMQITFSYLTTNFNIWWTAMSFILNFIFWTFEQVIIERNSHDTFIYSGDNYKFGVLILGGLLWVANKIILDKTLTLNSSVKRHTSKINSVFS